MELIIVENAEEALHCEISFWDTPPEALQVMDFVVVDDWYQVSHHGKIRFLSELNQSKQQVY